MSIQGIGDKIKGALGHPTVFPILLLGAVSIASFGLGRLSVLPERGEEAALAPRVSITQNGAVVTGVREIAEIEEPEPLVPEEETSAIVEGEGQYVASKNGTKYHLPWCAGAQAIKEDNKVWFKTKAEAESSGYSPAANCKGI